MELNATTFVSEGEWVCVCVCVRVCMFISADIGVSGNVLSLNVISVRECPSACDYNEWMQLSVEKHVFICIRLSSRQLLRKKLQFASSDEEYAV